LFKSIGSNWIFSLAVIVSSYFLTPFYVQSLGTEGYGVWLLITSTTGLLGLLLLGAPMASIRFISRHLAEGDQAGVNRIVGSCTGFYVMMGGATTVLGAGLFAAFSHYEIPAAVRADAYLAYAVVIVQIALGFVAQVPLAIMSAHQDFVLRNRVLKSGLLLRTALVFWWLTQHDSLTLLALALLVGQCFEMASAWLLVHRRYPGTRISLRDFDWGALRGVFSFSIFVMLVNIGGQLSFHTDSIVIGGVLGVGQIAYYSIGNSLAQYLMQLVLGISMVVMPLATRLHTQRREEELLAVLLKWTKITFLLIAMATTYLLVFGPSFLGWWIGPGFEGPTGAVLRILAVAHLIFLPVRGVAFPILMGIGKPRAPAIAFLLTGVANVGASIILGRMFGLPGIALGTALPNIAFAAYVFVLACRATRARVWESLLYIVPRVLGVAIPVLGALLWLRAELHPQGLLSLAAAGLLTVGLFALGAYTFIYRDDRYVDIHRVTARLLDRVPGLRALQARPLG